MKNSLRFLALLLAFAAMLSPLSSYADSSAPDVAGLEEIPEGWFDDALFIGDSITCALYNYNLVFGGLDNANIIYSNGFSCLRSAEKKYQMPFKGRMVNMGEAISQYAPGKIFLLFAMNDVGEPVENLRAAWNRLLDYVQQHSDADIYIQSGTPIYDETGSFTNENMLELNEMLRDICIERGHTYVDITGGLTDEEGKLKKELHLDYVHFNNDGCQIWIDTLHNPQVYFTAGSMEETNEK